jgi:hypothetical protein
VSSRLCALALVLAAVVITGCHSHPPPAPGETTSPSWQLLASELPEALLSISARSPRDVYAVGADKGAGPLVLHYDGTHWSTLATGTTGDLWWVQAQPNGPVLLGGAGGTILRYDGAHFERLPTPALAKQTVYGVWGTSGDDFYAVGSAGGRNGFIWHHHDGRFEVETIPLAVPHVLGGEVPGFFKVWGNGDEVWVVGALGAVLHRQGSAPFTVVPSGTTATLFTVSGAGDRIVAVGGSGNGVVIAGSFAGGLHDESPPGSGLLQGISVSAAGDWASGERGLVFSTGHGPGLTAVEHGLGIPPGTSLHAILRDAEGGVWAVGGDVLTPALDQGMLLHLDGATTHVPPVTLDDADEARVSPEAHAALADADASKAAVCPVAVVEAGKDRSIARRWDEQALAAIRLDLPRPTVHARNLFHLSAAMWDVWRAYGDPRDASGRSPRGVYVDEHHDAPDGNVEQARRTAISYAAYRLLARRYEHSPGAPMTAACLRAVMLDLGYAPGDVHETGDDPIAFGNRLAHTLMDKVMNDGANEAGDCNDPTEFQPDNAPLVYDQPGANLRVPDRWQPLNLSVAATQNGIVLPGGVQSYIGSHWGSVTPFSQGSASPRSAWADAGLPPKAGPELTRQILEVIAKTASVDPSDGVMMDISPGAYGHNPLASNDGHGWEKNPVTGKPYPAQVVLRADFARVMAEFWADGPQSETPPGHWNTLANAVSDSPGFSRRLFGKGEPLDPLAWDVHLYLALNGAEHDAAIAAWGLKRQFASVRPISVIRWMGGKGQSSDPKLPAYDPGGLPLVPGLIELVTRESSAPGQRHEALAHAVGQVAIRDWRGEPADRVHQVSGVGWVRAVDWITYQRRTFVTPAFPGFVSGHSTFSRAGAEVLTRITGSPYFPGGLGEFVVPRGFLKFEAGPTTDVHLQWAAYTDAADMAGQSRLWGSIHVQQDDFAGRRVGHRVGLNAMATAEKFFDGTAQTR